MEMKELRREVVSGEFDLEAGQSTSGSQISGHLAELHSQLSEHRASSYQHSRHNSRNSRRVKKDAVPPLRLGEGKLSGPMRFITCYASVLTFVVMTAIIIGLLLISPPFNVQPEVLPGLAMGKGRLGEGRGLNGSLANTTILFGDGYSGEAITNANIVTSALKDEYDGDDGDGAGGGGDV